MSAPPDLPTLYRDDFLLAVNKPSGMAVHRGLARERIVVLQSVRASVGSRLYPVHRLDRATSGALLLALDPATARRLQEKLQAGEVEKRYLALVRGIPPESGVIDHPVPRSPGGPRVPAVTVFRRLAVFERYALVEARPLTGRFHQIRRHFKHASHPLIGDVHYGKGEHNRLFRERFGLHRLALHALELAFAHPETGEKLRIFAPVPEDLAGPLRAIGMEAFACDPPHS
ncbi:MAG TPA: pseudouridine synthase [Thermoanaerobaculia bacterium]|jgi:tRNA pseudouridine65 synthase|nr:pseudouridine synthase [Thermoanaerobaculia bacterium]